MTPELITFGLGVITGAIVLGALLRYGLRDENEDDSGWMYPIREIK